MPIQLPRSINNHILLPNWLHAKRHDVLPVANSPAAHLCHSGLFLPIRLNPVRFKLLVAVHTSHGELFLPDRLVVWNAMLSGADRRNSGLYLPVWSHAFRHYLLSAEYPGRCYL